MKLPGHYDINIQLYASIIKPRTCNDMTCCIPCCSKEIELMIAPRIFYLSPTRGRPHDVRNSSLHEPYGDRPIRCTVPSVEGFIACQAGLLKGPMNR